MGASLRAPAIPRSMTQAQVITFLTDRLEMRNGFYMAKHGFDLHEVEVSCVERWGANAWNRHILRQAKREAAKRDGFTI